MFSSPMLNTWAAATVVAIVAGVVGFFVVLRGSAFVAHAVPQSAFAGAAGASLIGVNTVVGLGVFSLLGAMSIGLLGRRGRPDVATALAIVMMLGLGALFLSWSTEYASEIYSLLFGEVLGVSRGDLLLLAGLGAVCLVAVAGMFRPLMFSSVLPEVGEARGLRRDYLELGFLVIVALATTVALPVVGALLIFSLLIGPPAAARSFTGEPGRAVLLAVAIALGVGWASVALSYLTNLPIGFFVGTASALAYAVGRGWVAWRSRQGWQPARA